MSTPRQRSHHGCWTCKARRRKCDRARPTCTACDQRGIPCEGYEVRLRWGSGIASRGRFTGADEPVATSTPFRPKGRRRDRSRERRRRQLAEIDWSPSDTTLTPNSNVEDLDASFAEFSNSTPSFSAPEDFDEDERLFFQCIVLLVRFVVVSQNLWLIRHLFAVLSTGINILHSTTVNDSANILEAHLPVLYQKSKALFSICVAFQSSIVPDTKFPFLEYFDAALNHFRTELSHCSTHLPDETLTAGLILCSTSFVHGLPWTMHLHGMYRILHGQGLEESLSQQTPYRTHLLEVMGVMDLPTFAVGRRNPSIGFWRKYIYPERRKSQRKDPDIEIVSGLPRSLIDLLSNIGEGGAREYHFWNWPGCNGSLIQQQLWEAYRLAGILSIRHGQLHKVFELEDHWESRSPPELEAPTCAMVPDTPILVSRIASCLDAICRASADPAERESLILNAVHYPVFLAGLQADIVNQDQKLKHVIRRCFFSRRNLSEIGSDGQLLLELLEEWWQCDDRGLNIHMLAQARGVELGLL